MYLVGGWFNLAYTYDDLAPMRQEDGIVGELAAFSEGFEGSNIQVRWPVYNGEHFLTVIGFTNRPGVLGGELHTLLQMVSERLPESWGLLNEKDDERNVSPGRNACRAWVMRRGVLEERVDPFFLPLIEPAEDWRWEQQRAVKPLRGIDIARSRVVGVECSAGRVELAVDFALTIGHPAYADSGGRVRGTLWLGGVSDLYWTGQRSVGDLEEIMVDGELYRIRGGFGTMTAAARELGVEV